MAKFHFLKAHSKVKCKHHDLILLSLVPNWSFLWWCLEINYFYKHSCFLMRQSALCVLQASGNPNNGTAVNLIDYLCKCLKVEPLTPRHFTSFLFLNFDSKLDIRNNKSGKIPNSESSLERINVRERFSRKREALMLRLKKNEGCRMTTEGFLRLILLF